MALFLNDIFYKKQFVIMFFVDETPLYSLENVNAPLNSASSASTTQPPTLLPGASVGVQLIVWWELKLKPIQKPKPTQCY